MGPGVARKGAGMGVVDEEGSGGTATSKGRGHGMDRVAMGRVVIGRVVRGCEARGGAAELVGGQ